MTYTQKRELEAALLRLISTLAEMNTVNPKRMPIKDSSFIRWKGELEEGITKFKTFLDLYQTPVFQKPTPPTPKAKAPKAEAPSFQVSGSGIGVAYNDHPLGTSGLVQETKVEEKAKIDAKPDTDVSESVNASILSMPE